jgi:hypothetical protein
LRHRQAQVKEIANNLSRVVEQSLVDDVPKQSIALQEKLHNADMTAQAWNTFNEQLGSFADEHPTL